MQQVVAEYVFLLIVDYLKDVKTPILRHIAYLTVLTSLLTKVQETNSGQLFFQVIERLGVLGKLKSVILTNLEIPEDRADSEMNELWAATNQLQPILQEKTLYLFCALMDFKKLEFSKAVIE